MLLAVTVELAVAGTGAGVGFLAISAQLGAAWLGLVDLGGLSSCGDVFGDGFGLWAFDDVRGAAANVVDEGVDGDALDEDGLVAVAGSRDNVPAEGAG